MRQRYHSQYYNAYFAVKFPSLIGIHTPQGGLGAKPFTTNALSCS
jgi:hypothetical protein